MSLPLPVLCLVTDRRRLGARLGSLPDSAATIDALLTQASAASEAGVTLIQVREPDLRARALVALIRAIRARVAPHTGVVVNDRRRRTERCAILWGFDMRRLIVVALLHLPLMGVGWTNRELCSHTPTTRPLRRSFGGSNRSSPPAYR